MDKKIKEKISALENQVSKWRTDYWRVNDENEILKTRMEERQKLYNQVCNTLSSEITDLKIILGGAVCKDNPFINKQQRQIEYPFCKPDIITP